MDSRKNSELYEFSKQIMNEYRKLDPDGEMHIQVGNKRNIIRSISNTSLIVTVLDDEELDIIKRMYHAEKGLQRERKKSNKIETLVGNLNNSNVTTRDGIENVKRNSKNNNKKSVKKSNSKKKSKFKMSKKTKEKAKDLLKKTGIKVGIGITSLALAATFAANSAIEMKENVARYDKEFDNIGEVEDKIKDIMTEEIKKALNNDNIEINISRLAAYKEEGEGIKVTVTDSKNHINEKVFKRRNGIDGATNMKSNLLRTMAENYLDVSSISDENISNKDKSKAIRLLEEVETKASKKDLEIKNNEVLKILSGNDYVIKDTAEGKAGDER